jgi:hypothetical protein
MRLNYPEKITNRVKQFTLDRLLEIIVCGVRCGLNFLATRLAISLETEDA